jgi:hypothetical protein
MFRNHFMHFKPAWHDDKIHGSDLVRDLRQRNIPTVPSQTLFPLTYMTYGCAKWAVQTVLTFSSEFAMLIGVSDRFAPLHPDFTLP